MDNDHAISEVVLISVVVNFGLGSKVLKIAKKSGVRGGAIFLGTGTVRNRILEFLELTDIRKEVVMMAASETVADAALESLDEEFDFKKPYHGIVFTMRLSSFLGAGKYEYVYCSNGGSDNIMYNSIFVIVDKGKAEFVMDSATSAGARGGTIIKARGSGIHETSKVFQMDIEPEKEMVLILSEVASTEKIVTTIRDRLELDKPGNGIIFCIDVNKAHGLSK